MAEESVQAKEFDFEDWLAEGVKGLRTTCKELRPFLPKEFRQHTKAARREMLLAMRSLLDAAIACTEEKEKSKTKKKTTKIKVE
jgi:DNA topoisomerase VI subunit B